MDFNLQLAEKDVVWGTFVKTNDPFFVEILGKSGFDFAILDNEHGPNSVRDLYPLVMACRLNSIAPIVRVGKLSDIEIQRVLDIGIAGIQVPQIQDGESAELVRRFTKFHPKGMRGVCRFVRAADFSLTEKSAYFTAQNELTVIAMVEGAAGIKNFDQILEVEDIDVLFIGPYDLSQALGVPGEVRSPKVLGEIEKLVAKCKAKSRNVGIFVDSIETAKLYKEMGVKYIAFSVDVGIFADACRSLAGQLKEL